MTEITEGICKKVSVINACHEFITFTPLSRIIWSIVDVTIDSTVHLQCQFCNKSDDYIGKTWYFMSAFNNYTLKEVSGKETAVVHEKMTMLLNHTMILYNFSHGDAGIYYCQYYRKKKERIFSYILDDLFMTTIKCRKGTFSQWFLYKKYYLDSINIKFKSYLEEPYLALSTKYNSYIQVVTVWDTWGQCEPVNNIQGRRKRLGRCRIQLQAQNTNYHNTTNLGLSYILSLGFEFRTPQDMSLSCRSIKLHKFLHKYGGRLLNHTPDYEAWESCYPKNIESKELKLHEITKQVVENSFLDLKCQGALQDSHVIWYRNKKILDSKFRNNIADSTEEPHITIDFNNVLHLVHITKQEEGNYTCSVDGKKSYKYTVKVVPKSALLNQEFIRYSLYLGFVLSLTLSCYCAGICIAWHRRSSFADPQGWNNRVKYRQL